MGLDSAAMPDDNGPVLRDTRRDIEIPFNAPAVLGTPRAGDLPALHRHARPAVSPPVLGTAAARVEQSAQHEIPPGEDGAAAAESGRERYAQSPWSKGDGQ